MSFFSDVLEAVKERIRNPITGAFTLSWVSWNWKTFILLFGELQSKDKIIAIVDLYPSPLWFALKLFVGPLLVALVFVLVFPVLSMWPLRKNAEARAKLSDMQHKVRKTQTVSGEKHEAMKDKYEEELQQKLKVAEHQQERIDTLSKRLADAASSEQAPGDLHVAQEANDTISLLESYAEKFEAKDKEQKAFTLKGLAENVLVSKKWQLGSEEEVVAELISFSDDGTFLESPGDWKTWIVMVDGILYISNEKGSSIHMLRYSADTERFSDLDEIYYLASIEPISRSVIAILRRHIRSVST